MRLHFSSSCLPLLSLVGKDVDMGNPREKQFELDHPHSKRHRDGVHTVFCDSNAQTLVASESKCAIHKVC